MERIRCKTYWNYYCIHALTAAIQIFFFVLAHILIASVLGWFYLGGGLKFQAHRIEDFYSSSLEFLLRFQDYFQNPVQAISCVSLYLFLGSLFVYQLIFFAFEIVGKKGMLLQSAILVISTMAGFITNVSNSMFAPFFFNNYFILHHILFLAGMRQLFVCCSVLLLLPLFLFLLALRLKYGKRHNGRIQYLSAMIQGRTRVMLLYIMAITLLGIVPMLGTGCDGLDVIVVLLKGYSKRKFDLTEFLYFLSFFAYPLLIIHAFLQKEKCDKNMTAKFRSGSAYNWRKQTERECTIFLWKYLLLWLSILAGTVFVAEICKKADYSSDWQMLLQWYQVSNEEAFWAIAVTLLFRAVELYLLYQMGLLIFRLTEKSVAAFLLPFVIYVLPLKLLGGACMYQNLEQIQAKGVQVLFLRLLCYIMVFVILYVVNYFGGEKDGICYSIKRSLQKISGKGYL